MHMEYVCSNMLMSLFSTPLPSAKSLRLVSFEGDFENVYLTQMMYLFCPSQSYTEKFFSCKKWVEIKHL